VSFGQQGRHDQAQRLLRTDDRLADGVPDALPESAAARESIDRRRSPSFRCGSSLETAVSALRGDPPEHGRQDPALAVVLDVDGAVKPGDASPGLVRIVSPAAAATLRLSICARLISPSSSLRQNSTSWCS